MAIPDTGRHEEMSVRRTEQNLGYVGTMGLERHPARVGTSKVGSIWLTARLFTQNPPLVGFEVEALGLQGRGGQCKQLSPSKDSTYPGK